MRTAPLLALSLLTLLLAGPAVAAPLAHDDDVALRALADEVARYKSVSIPSLAATYYLAGYVNDDTGYEVGASFGAIVERHNDDRRSANVAVRVGTPELDNENFSDPQSFNFFAFGHRGPGLIPSDADYDAIRQGLWLKFDDAYKDAAEALARKNAYLQTNSVEGRPPDFGPAPVVSLILPRAKLAVDEGHWADVVRHVSAVFQDVPGAQTGSADFRANAQNQCFVSSDPVQHRFGDTFAHVEISTSRQAADGMDVAVHYEATGRDQTDLPKEPELIATARKMAAQLSALASAPALPEDYSGPVLFTGGAAARFFLSGVGEPLSHPRDPVGEPHPGRLTERLGKHVATPLLTVRDDPTMKTWHGKQLLGWYPIDDDGVKPQPITLIAKGVLKTYYMSRVPTRDLQGSNGHSRAGEGSVGNLFVEGAKPLSREALKKKLIALAKEADLPYGILVEAVGEGSGLDMRSMMFPAMGGGGDISMPPPTVAYRVFPDGHEELVRGAAFKPMSFRVLTDIVALGNDPTLVNTTSSHQLVSVVAPSVLVKQVELQRPMHEFEKPPVILRPALTAAP